MSIFIFGMSPASVYIANKFLDDGYAVKHVHSHGGKYSKQQVLDHVCDSLSKNKYRLVFPTIFKNQRWPALQAIVKEQKCPAILPSMEASRLESSKLYAKRFLQNLGIPTARLLTETPADTAFVVKSDVYQDGLQTIITSGSGSWPNCIIEEYLTGPEYSYHALLNNRGWTYLGSARDYKKLYDDDIGPNTVGLGSYSMKDRIEPIVHEYMDKIYFGLKKLNIEYVGVMYLGIMVVDGVPHVLEINTRIGDPEIQSIGETVTNFTDMLLATGQDQKIPEAVYTKTEAVTIKLINKEYGSEFFQEPIDLTGSHEIKLCKSEDISVTYGTLHTIAESRQAAAHKIYTYLNGRDMGSYRYRTDIGLLL